MKLSILRRKGSSKATVMRIINNLDDAQILDKPMIRESIDGIIFRFGGKYPIKSKYEINTITMIKTMDNKGLVRKVWQDNDISVPHTFFNKKEIQKYDAQFPLIGQPTYHVGGRGIIISKNMKDIYADMTSTHWAEIIDKDREWRIYVFFGRVIGVEEKVPTDRKAIAWNYSLGNSTFHAITWAQYPLSVCNLAIQAATKLNIDFSAVDIISKHDKNYVLEVNASPSCTVARCRCIARALGWVRDMIEKNDAKPKYLSIPHIIRNYKDVIHPCMID